MKFLNYECKLCHNLISYEVNDRQFNRFAPSSMMMCSAKRHPHCTYISQLQKDEELIFELVTVSNSPLTRAVDIIYQKDIHPQIAETKEIKNDRFT